MCICVCIVYGCGIMLHAARSPFAISRRHKVRLPSVRACTHTQLSDWVAAVKVAKPG